MREKKIMLKVLLIIAVLYSCTTSKDEPSDCVPCSSLKHEGVEWAGLETAPYIDCDYPDWLSENIKEIETWKIPTKAQIFMCEWKGQIVYYVRNPFDSCGFCRVYYKDGKKVEWTEEDLLSDSFCSESKNWVLIYEFGDNILENLENLEHEKNL